MQQKISLIVKVRITTLYATVLLIAVCLPLFSEAQEIKINALVDTPNILIGDQIKLKLSATYNPQNYLIQFPYIPDSFNHFELISKSKIDTSISRNETSYTQTFTLTNFDSGQWAIPSFNFEIQSLKGQLPSTQKTDSIAINVNTIAVDTAKPFKPIMAIRDAKMPWQIFALYIAFLILGIALLGFLIWYVRKKLRKKSKKNAPIAQQIILSPHQKALQQLQKIKAEAKWTIGEEKTYHTELTDVVQIYLEEQFGIDCFEKTSSEIMQQIKKIKALATSRQSLRTLFETADMVKFAKSKPNKEDHEQCLVQAAEFIHESNKKISPIENQTNF
jgi:uncharacterized protein YneF (UPF0154 family)